MRVTEIIRGILDVIDGVDAQHQPPKVKPEATAYRNSDIKRFKQTVDLAGDDTAAEYSNTPKEQYADIDAVTVDAGSDGWQGTKDPADIRGEHPRLYPGTV